MCRVGCPSTQYVPRNSRKLEGRLREVRDNLCKLVTVTGATKSGKTVLTSRVFPRDEAIWVDGGTVKDEEDLWSIVLEQLDAFTATERQSGSTVTSGTRGGIKARIGLPGVAHVEGSAGSQDEEETLDVTIQSRRVAPRTAATTALREFPTPLVIDDFHYLDRRIQGDVIRALKPLVAEGLPFVLIAIPHRRFDAVRVEREMTGRLDSIDIPMWDHDELLLIAQNGFPLLNVIVDDDICHRFAGEAQGSPHLMQEFCRGLMKANEVEMTLAEPAIISALDDELFRTVAAGTGKVVFDKLSRGPRQRADRLQRQLRNGGTADIYQVVLMALTHMAPGMATVEYEQLRTAIREVLVSDIPQMHEVTRVLEKMAEIAADDEASTPVIDWEKDEQLLHITDPFFAFYLKWGTTAA